LSTPAILGLGAVAGFTIFLGLPVGRLRETPLVLRAFLNAVATGVLLFLFWDVLAEGIEPVDDAIGESRWAATTGYGLLFVGGIGVGLLSLVYYERWMKGRAVNRPFGPGAANVAEVAGGRVGSPARRLSVLIAVGIGLHNFAEGLAIGQSAAKGAVDLAVLLIIGFGLHNATEGFGIVAPLAADAERPSWGFLAVVGLIGGGPTFLGTVLGQAFVNQALSTVFLTLAAGSILYVVVQLLGVGTRMGHRDALMWGLLVGLVAGFGTDFVVAAAGV
jgi:ZIP family zinc transporter